MEISYPLATVASPEGPASPWRRARSLIALDREDAWLCVVYSIAIGLLSLVTPVAVQALVNTVSFGSVLQPIVVMTVLVAMALTFAGVTRLLQAYVIERLQERMLVRGVLDISRRLLTARPETLRAASPSDLAHRFFEMPTIQKSISTVFVDGIDLLLKLAVGLPLLAFYHPLLLVFALVLLLSIAFIVVVLGRGALATAVGESTAKYEAASWIAHLARIPASFRSEAVRRDAHARAELVARRYREARRQHFGRLIRHLVGGIVLKVAGATVLLGVGGALVIESQLTLGQLVAAELVFAAIGAAMLKLHKQLEAAYDLVASAHKLGALLDLPLERTDGAALSGDGPARIALHDVTAGYGDTPAFDGVDLVVERGERVAVTGAGGRGKSTLLDVAATLLSPRRGHLEIDGLDARLLDLESVRGAVVLVREPELVDSTILTNLRLLHREASLAEVEAVLRVVGLADVVRALPDGLATELHVSGHPLSRAQVRRLSLARALIAKPRVLLLDGALDDLALGDAEREGLLDYVLGSEAPWTALVVTEEPAVRARCTRVFGLDTEVV